MKKFFIALTLILYSPILLNGWGILDSNPQPLAIKIMKSEPITVYLNFLSVASFAERDDILTLEAKGYYSQDPKDEFFYLPVKEMTPYLQEQIKGAVDQWRINVKNWINQSVQAKVVKAEDFKDISAAFVRPVQVTFVADPAQANLIVSFRSNQEATNDNCTGVHNSGIACARFYENNQHSINVTYSFNMSKLWREQSNQLASSSPVRTRADESRNRIYKKSQASSEKAESRFTEILRHEVGHTLGLSDQFIGWGTEQQANYKKGYYLEEALPANSLMTSNKKNPGCWQEFINQKDITCEPRSLGCDDAEGLINVIDLFNTNKEKPVRFVNGWKSFCGRSYWYMEAKPLTEAEYDKAYNDKAAQGLLAQSAKQQEDKKVVKKEVEEGTQAVRDQLAAELAARSPAPQNNGGAVKRPSVASAASSSSGVALSKPLPSAMKPSDSGLDSAGVAGTKAASKHELDSFIEKNRSSILASVQKQKAGGILDSKERALLTRYNSLYGQYSQRVPSASEVASKSLSKSQLKLNERGSSSNDSVSSSGAKLVAGTPKPASGSLSKVPVEATASKKMNLAKGTATLNMKPAAKPAKPEAKLAAKPEAKLTAKPEAKLAAKPEAKLAAKPEAKLAAKPEAKLTAKPEAKLEEVAADQHRCAVCGKEIAPADAYQATAHRFVHKHSQCAYSYFSQRYPTDAAALASYEAYHFFRTPANVTAAKGLMKELGLSVSDIKNYAGVSSAQIEEQKKEMKEAQQERQAKAAAEKAEPAVYQNVSRADVNNYLKKNNVALNAIHRKQSAGKALSKKERRILRGYNQLYENYKLTEQYAQK